MEELTCKNCAWTTMVKPPKGKEDELTRGYCTFEPPSVFPMPKQTSNLARPHGDQQVQFLPLMLRPVVYESEPICGRFAPNEETMSALGIAPPGAEKGHGCSDCKKCDPATCNCDTEEGEDNVS